MSVVVARDTLAVEGPDAERYLQGQLSNDVGRLAVGESTWAFLLEPSGKLGHLVRVRREQEQTFVLDAEPGTASAIEARLRRFLIRTKVTIAVGVVHVDLDGGDGTQLVGWWGEGHHAVTSASPADDDAAVAEHRRIDAGWPGPAELDEGRIPGETGVVSVAASFTKGCYTGQELVARVDSRGNNVPFHLSRFELTASAAPGSPVLLDGEPVGQITSAAGTTALGYLARRVEVPAAVTVAGAAASAFAQRMG